MHDSNEWRFCPPNVQLIPCVNEVKLYRSPVFDVQRLKVIFGDCINRHHCSDFNI